MSNLDSTRQGILKTQQTLKMARSAHAYVRGSTVKFYEWLDAQRPGTLPEGPPVWICGDCHAGNLGPLADADGKIRVQIRDLDQTVIGNPSHDLIRLALSLTTASRGSNLPGVTAAKMMEAMIAGYEEALRTEDDLRDMPKTIRLVVRQSARRTWKHLAEERIRNTKPTIPLGKKFLSISDLERQRIKKLFATSPLQHLITALKSRKDDCRLKVADAAYWIKGCSSLGLLRYAVLVKVGSGRSAEYALMDIKEAVTASAPRYKKVRMPKSNGDRVVEGARNLSPNLGERMVAGSIGNRSVFIRELLPQDLKFDFDSMAQDEAEDVAKYLATVVGKAHGRQMDGAERKQWLRTLAGSKSKSLDAPSWLWSSVVSLVASHEAAYLEHCRRFALAA
ncbi:MULTISPECIES: DUF2252 family protein [unclassified Bradyrhizobium]|uniref:DUF2252 family protein n=1 Tax=unclassified Bradyrhizobium TaxID=2631580 RepID=UPI00289C9B9C|nr:MULTISPECIES: DUF2252 family protein [unclassified Bradyrhizobium]